VSQVPGRNLSFSAKMNGGMTDRGPPAVVPRNAIKSRKVERSGNTVIPLRRFCGRSQGYISFVAERRNALSRGLRLVPMAL